jgi:hypothetical protein
MLDVLEGSIDAAIDLQSGISRSLLPVELMLLELVFGINEDSLFVSFVAFGHFGGFIFCPSDALFKEGALLLLEEA